MRADTIARLGDFEFLLSQGVAPLDAARRCGWKSWKSFQKCALRAGRKLPVCKNGHLREEWGCLTKAVALAKHGLDVCLELATNDAVNPSLIEVETGYQIHDFALHHRGRPR